MSIFLSSRSTGLSKGIIIAGDDITVTDVDECPEGSWHLGEKAHFALGRVALARSINLSVLPSDPRIEWWKQWTPTPRIDLVLSKKAVAAHIKTLIDTCKRVTEDSYYAGQYQTQNLLLDSFQSANVDLSLLRQQDDNVIDTFAANTEGQCARIEYDNYGSSTGRMSVKSGPKILTMSKELRHIFRSSWGDEGTLLSVDYNALEPRVIMTLMGAKTLPADIYTSIGEKLQLAHVSRKTLKLMILAILYGMARKNFIVKFMSEQDPDVAYDRIRDKLGVKDILARIKQDMHDGFIRNHFGRPLSCENESLYVNHFTQSTAVDVACEGFLNLVKDNSDIIRPIFILHDELVVDVKNSDLEKLRSRIGSGIYIPSLETSFHVTTKVFNARKSD